MELNYIQFTKEMKKDYTILAPNMLPMHLKMVLKIMQTYGYNVELLETTGPRLRSWACIMSTMTPAIRPFWSLDSFYRLLKAASTIPTRWR